MDKPELHICAGCGEPIMPDGDGRTSYRSFLSTSDEPPDKVHNDETCVTKRNASRDERDLMLAAISSAWRGSQTPQALRAACLAFHTENQRHVEQLTAMLLVTMGSWVIEGTKQGHDRHVLEQVASAEAQRCIAVLMREAKERRGEPYVPARQAIVAFAIATNVANAGPFECDIDGAVAAWEASLESEAA